MRNVETEVLLSLLGILKKSLRLKDSFIIVNLECFADDVISLISRDKRSEKYLPIASCDRNRVVEYDCIILFFYFWDVCARYLKFGIAKKYVWWIESWMEK